VRSAYGKRGGEGPTRGKTATTYTVTLPDGSTVKKRMFETLIDPVGYAYQHEGTWYVASVRERNDATMQHCVSCEVRAK